MTTPTALARAMHGVIDPLNAILYLSSTARAGWEALGLEPRAQGYVAGRASPLGPIGPEIATAIFFNFNPVLFAHTLPAVWDITSPVDALDARARIIETIFSEVGAPRDGLDEATEIARAAASAAPLEGRPLAAANLGVPEPATPFARLWQALTVLREHRGDGHIALLMSEGIDPVEAIVLFSGWQSTVSRRFLQSTRLWDDDAWAAAEERLAGRGLVGEDGLNDDGRAFRHALEDRTDALAAAPWSAIGPDRTLRLFDLLVPLVEALNDGGAWKRPVAVPERPS